MPAEKSKELSFILDKPESMVRGVKKIKPGRES